jgi:tripartite-type tricarboxylate transporter receptor subunit TctC
VPDVGVRRRILWANGSRATVDMARRLHYPEVLALSTALAWNRPMSHSPSRRECLLAAATLAVPGLSWSQPAWPGRPLRILLPFPPGGSTDPIARVLAQKLSEAWGQPVVVDNRPGGNTIIGTEALAKAAPDGYTLLYTASTHVINALLMPNLPYDSVRDFQPVATLVRSDFVLVVHPSVAARDLREFIALAKSRPGTINYATSGTGNPNHLAGEYFAMVAGARMNPVPYKGGGPAINDLLGGQVQAMFSVPTSVVGHIKAGKLRALAHTGSKPLPGLDVPTFAQAGLPGFDLGSWNGVFVPAGTPRAIVDKLAAEIARILAMPDVIGRLAAQGQEPWYRDPEQFATLLASDRQRYGAIIKAANIKLD